MTKHFCDLCGNELRGEPRHCETIIDGRTLYMPLIVKQDSPSGHTLLETCNECAVKAIVLATAPKLASTRLVELARICTNVLALRHEREKVPA